MVSYDAISDHPRTLEFDSIANTGKGLTAAEWPGLGPGSVLTEFVPFNPSNLQSSSIPIL